MENRTYTIVLSMVFALIAVLTCLIAVVLLWMFQQGGPPLLAVQGPTSLPTPTLAPTIQISLALEPTLVVPTPAPPPAAVATSSPISLVAPTSVGPMPTQPVFLSIPLQQTPLRVVATATRSTPKSLPRSTPTPEGPAPTATLPGNFQFVADGEVRPDPKRACTGAAIFGYFHDTEGKPIAGARVKVYNQYLSDFSAPSKPVDAPDAGYYDFLINPKPSSWNVVVVDGANSPISPEVQVIRPDGVEVCYFQLDWKATR